MPSDIWFGLPLRRSQRLLPGPPRTVRPVGEVRPGQKPGRTTPGSSPPSSPCWPARAEPTRPSLRPSAAGGGVVAQLLSRAAPSRRRQRLARGSGPDTERGGPEERDNDEVEALVSEVLQQWLAAHAGTYQRETCSCRAVWHLGRVADEA